MFSFHHAMSAIAFTDPETGQSHLLANVKAMNAAGWTTSDGELRKVLPRADRPSLVGTDAPVIRRSR